MDKIRITPELYEQLKYVKSAEELRKAAEERGLTVTEEEAAVLYKKYFASGKISDDELGSVSGGGCYDAICQFCNGKLTYKGEKDTEYGTVLIFQCDNCGKLRESHGWLA